MSNLRIDLSGNRAWYNEPGQMHRTDGPAAVHTDGDKFWCLNGLLHRTTGPAVEWSDGDKSWFIHGQKLTEEDFTLLAFVCYNTV